MSDYIKLYRSFLNWEWYKNINTKTLFIHMLMKANWKEGKFEGLVIPRGSFVSSLDKLSNDTSLTKDEIRTALKHLISTNEVTKHSYSKFTVFTVVNYNAYQDIPTQVTTQLPNTSHSIPTLFPSIEEKKEGKKGKNNNILCKADASALFEKLWKEYPNKKGKGQVSDTAKKRIFDVGEEEMLRAIERYKKYLKDNEDWLRPKDGSTFFNSGYVDYLDANYEESATKPVKERKDKFTQFEQREYDFDAIERNLLGKGGDDG